jgi:hypothetical protein
VAVLAAKLCDVAPDGTSSLVTRGLLDLTHRRSHAEPEPLEPGRPATVELELDCTAWRFAAGHRLRLDLAAADWPGVWPTPAPAGLAVARGSCRLELTALPAPSLPPPCFADPPELPKLAEVLAEVPRYQVIHDFLDRSIRVRGRIGREVRLPWGTTVREWREMESVLRPEAPAEALSTGAGGVVLRRADAVVEVRTALSVQAAPSMLSVRLALEVDRDGQPFFRRRWEEEIPRRPL